MKRLLLISFLGLAVFILVVFSLIQKQSSPIGISQSPTPTPVLPPAVQFQSISYHELFKDPQIAKNIGDKLQNPVSIDSQDNYLVGHFASDAATFSTDVYEQNQIAKFIIQTASVDNNYYSDYLLTHSVNSEKTLYDPSQAGSAFVWKVFSEDGVAFLTNPSAGFTGKVLYFIPTTYDKFLKEIAPIVHISSSQAPEQENNTELGQ